MAPLGGDRKIAAVIHRSVHIVEDVLSGTSLLYAVGSNLVLNHINAKKQSFLPLSLAYSSQGQPSLSGKQDEKEAVIPIKGVDGLQDQNMDSLEGKSAQDVKGDPTVGELAKPQVDRASTPTRGQETDASKMGVSPPYNSKETITDGITATFVSANYRFVAIATRSRLRLSGTPLPPEISIFDLQTMRLRRTIQPLGDTIVGREFVSVCMSADNKLLVAATGTPDWRVCTWSVDSGRFLAVATTEDIAKTLPGQIVAFSSANAERPADSQARPAPLSRPSTLSESTSLTETERRRSSRFLVANAAAHEPVTPSVTKVSMNPLDVSMLIVSGPNIFRVLRLETSGGFRVVPTDGVAQEGKTFLSHSWHPSRLALVATTSKSDLLILSIPRPTSSTQRLMLVRDIRLQQPAYSTASLPSGFATGSADGTVTLWDWNPPKNVVQKPVTAVAPGEIIPDNATIDVTQVSAPENQDFVDYSKIQPIRAWSAGDEGSSTSPVLDLSVTKDGLQLVCCLGDNSIKGFDLVVPANRDIRVVSGKPPGADPVVIVDGENRPSLESGVSVNYAPHLAFHLPNHSQSITSLSIAVRKPLVATSSGDRTVRVWNYLDPYAPSIYRKFADDAFSVAMHPSGMYLAVAFMDRVRLLAVTVDDLRQVHEFAVRGCRECVFSPGGQFLALAYGTSPGTIQIHDAWSWARLSMFRGHSGKVKSIAFAADDRFLITAGTDGLVYGWEWKIAKRVGEVVIKGAQWVNVVVAPPSVAAPKVRPQSPAAAELSTHATKGVGRIDDLHGVGGTETESMQPNTVWAHVFGVTSDRLIREIADMQVVREISADVSPSQLVISQTGTSMIVGTVGGTIRSYKFPFEDDKVPETRDDSSSIMIPRQAGEFVEHQVHAGPVSRIKMSWDDRYLFSVGEDGCLFVFNVVDGRSKHNLKDRDWAYGDEALISRSELDERLAVLADTKLRLEELKLDRDYQLRVREVEFNEKVKDLTDSYTESINSLKGEVELLSSCCVQEKNAAAAEMQRESAQHRTRIAEIEHEGSSLFYNEVGITEQAEQVLRDTKLSQDAAIVGQDMRFTREIESSTLLWEGRLEEQDLEVAKCKLELELAQQDHVEELNQNSGDNEVQLKMLTVKFDRDMAGEKEMAIKLRSETGIFLKKMLALQDDVVSLASDKAKALEEKRRAEDQVRKVRERLADHERELRLRDQQIDEIEKRIYELKKKNADLEKWKFVLDFKINEIKGNIEPRAVETEAAASRITEVGEDLSETDQALHNGKLHIAELTLALTVAVERRKQEKRRRLSCECRKRRFIEESERLFKVAVQDDLKTTRKLVAGMYKSLCPPTINVPPSSSSLVREQIDKTVAKEIAGQLSFLRNELATLDRQYLKGQGTDLENNRKAIKPLQEELSLIRPLEHSAEHSLENTRERARKILSRTTYRVKNALETDSQIMERVNAVTVNGGSRDMRSPSPEATAIGTTFRLPAL
ncbi:Cilia- and flagella-associated protein 57 [Gonapodya sp. JEL0774]|nr:Cilia- and flagella-associated protein 57 [Gonapodya sp. JEL0774]